MKTNKQKELSLQDVIDKVTTNVTTSVNRNIDTKLENVVKTINAHTDVTVERVVEKAAEELAGITARQFLKVDKRLNRIEGHLNLNKFEFSES